MLLLQDVGKGDLVDEFFAANFFVPLEQNRLRVDDADGLHGLAEVRDRHGLTLEDVIRVKQRIVVLRSEETIRWLAAWTLDVWLVHDLVSALHVFVLGFEFLDCFQQLHEAVFGVLGPLIEDARQKFVEELLDPMGLHVLNG